VPVVINRHPIAIFASLDDHLKFILERVDASARPEIFRYAGEQIVKDFYGNRGVPFEFLDDSLREAAEVYNDFPYIIEDTL
jgi:Zn/Cd-binding protein ZinT